MNLTNFRFETDADGIALVDLGHAGPLDERDQQRGGRGARPRSSTRSRVTKRSKAPSSRRARMGSPAAPTSRCSKSSGDEYARLIKDEGKEAAMRFFVDRTKQLSLDLPAARDLRQAGRRRDQRRMHGRRLRACARVPLSYRRGRGQGARRTARNQGRAVPRRRRHPASGATDADAGGAADAAQGRPDPPRRGQEDGPRRTRSRPPIRSSRSPRPG